MPGYFSPLEREVWGGFLSAFSHINHVVEADLQDRARITHAEFEILLRLMWADDHRLRLQDLAAQSLLTRSGVSRTVERLERAGLVNREEAREDRRGAYAILTEAGVARFQLAAEEHMTCVRQHFLGLFNEEELTAMAGFWKRIEDHHLSIQHQSPSKT